MWFGGEHGGKLTEQFTWSQSDMSRGCIGQGRSLRGVCPAVRRLRRLEQGSALGISSSTGIHRQVSEEDTCALRGNQSSTLPVKRDVIQARKNRTNLLLQTLPPTSCLTAGAAPHQDQRQGIDPGTRPLNLSRYHRRSASQ